MNDPCEKIKKERDRMKEELSEKDRIIAELRSKMKHLRAFEMRYYGEGIVESDRGDDQ